MRIYSKIVVSHKGEIIEQEYQEYNGNIAKCFGGSSSSGDSTTIQQMSDPEAERRMAAVAERQQDLSEDQWDEYLTTFQPYDRDLAASNQRLIAPNEALTTAQLGESTRLVPLQGEVQEQSLNMSLQNMKDTEASTQGLLSDYYSSAREGLNVRSEADKAASDAAREYGKAGDMAARDFLSRGGDINSSAYSRGMAGMSMDRVKGISSARTNARTNAELINFDRLSNATNLSLSTPATGMTALPNQQGETQLGDYQLNSTADRSVDLAGNSISANKAGMSPLTNSKSRSSSFGFNLF